MSGLRTRSACIALMLAAMAPLLAGCNEPTAAAAVAAAPAEPEVGIVTVRPQARAIVRELPGRIAPTRVSEVRPRVSGIVVERLFQQGTEVKAGDPLYRIDPKPFEVEVQASEAALAKATAALDLAAQHAQRIATLTSQRAAPEAENEKAIAPNARRKPRSAAARPMSRAPGSISTTRRSARRSTASSARRWSAKARWWCRTKAPVSPRSSSSIRSMPTSPSRSPR